MPSTAILGKRKRRPAQKAEDDSTDAPALEDVQAIFRKHFEAQFAPIQNGESSASSKKIRAGAAAAAAQEEDDSEEDGVEDMRSDSESSDDDQWGGLSAEDDSEEDDSDMEQDDDSEAEIPTVEVIDHSKPLPNTTGLAAQGAAMSKREMRAYLSSRPPDTTTSSSSSSSALSKAAAAGRDAANEDPQNEDSKTLLANDLELQRLINESHILSASNPFHRSSANAAGGETTAAFSEGRIRKLTTDLRLQKLGSKESIFTQRKMPMAMRQGIDAARGARDDKRRREAKENGIILEKAAPDTKKKKKKGGSGGSRGGDVGMRGIGRFSGGELRLSKRAVREIEMEGKRMDFGGKRRRRRR